MYDGGAGISCRTDVGWCFRCWIIDLQSSSMCFHIGVRGVLVGLPVMAISTGINRHLPPGIARHACCSLPASCWNTFSGAVRYFNVFLMSMHMSSHFSGGSCIVYCFPSTNHPRISLMNIHKPSLFSNFFSETGSASQ